MLIIKKTIEIAGWLSEREIGQGKTALWTGRTIEESLEINDNYYFEEELLEAEVAKAQAYANRLVADNNWYISPAAYVNTYTFDTSDFE